MRETIDLSILQSPVSGALIRQAAKQHRHVRNIRLIRNLLVAAGGFFLFLALLNLKNYFIDGTPGSWHWVPFLILAIGLLIYSSNRQKYLKRMVRVIALANQQGLQLELRSRDRSQSGFMFNVGYSRVFSEVLSGEWGEGGKLHFETARYKYSTGSGENRHTYHVRYLRVDLKRNLPHMVLDANKNNLRLFGKTVFSNLPAQFDRSQKLSLEGNFDQYFTLYAPRQYERDALYIFTPDLMALLIDGAADCDVEVVDNYIYFYFSPTKAVMTDHKFMPRVFKLLTLLGDKVYDRTDYYADERVVDRQLNVVAEGGRRLKLFETWWFWVALVIGMLLILWLNGFKGTWFPK